MILPATICFAALAILTLIAAATGYRGLVCDSERGYPVPDHVARNPELAERANQSVAFWCTGTAVLSVAPLFPLIGMLTDGIEGQNLTTASLAVLAAYGTLLVGIGRLPFHLIKRYAPEPA
ncbi:hypothetical protein OG216_37480 [Streptomycetaceae bacterium NBC_01309]